MADLRKVTLAAFTEPFLSQLETVDAEKVVCICGGFGAYEMPGGDAGMLNECRAVASHDYAEVCIIVDVTAVRQVVCRCDRTTVIAGAKTRNEVARVAEAFHICNYFNKPPEKVLCVGREAISLILEVVEFFEKRRNTCRHCEERFARRRELKPFPVLPRRLRVDGGSAMGETAGSP